MSSSEESNGEVESLLVDSILPAKSKTKYLLVYSHFIKWKTKINEKSFSEKVFLSYFNEMSKTRKASSLWAIYSMLKSTLRAKHNIYLDKYVNLLLWLKRQSVGYQSVKSKILTEADIKKFIDEAPDEKYLATKVALILGVCGACRAIDLTALTTNNIKIIDDVMLCVLHDSTTNVDKMFAIREEFIPFVKKYQALRPENLDTDRFFMNFRDGHCTKQVIGRHKMAALPKEIARYLKLPNPENYLGRCFRRSAAAFGAIVTSVDKCNKGKLIEVPRGSGQNEFAEMVKFAKRYKSGNAIHANVDLAVEHLTGDDPDQTEEMELTTDEVYIKTEDIALLATDEIHIKSEDDDGTNELDRMIAFETINDMPTMSQPSGSGKKSRSADFIIEDSDEDDLEDLVHIKSEDVDRKTTLRSLREEISHGTSNPHDTNITVAGKNITILFKNCTNVGNVTVNIINK